jgi:uncharacterized protein YpmS
MALKLYLPNLQRERPPESFWSVTLILLLAVGVAAAAAAAAAAVLVDSDIMGLLDMQAGVQRARAAGARASTSTSALNSMIATSVRN